MDWRTSSHRNGTACVQWRTSSRSANNGACVEVAALEDLAVLVRDSTDPGGPVLAFTAEAWLALVRRVKAGDGT